MKTLTIARPFQWPFAARIGLLVTLLVIEIELVEVALRRYFDASNLPDSFWAPVLGYQVYLFSLAVVLPTAFVLTAWPRLRGHVAELKARGSDHPWLAPFGLQVLAYAVFAASTYTLSVHYPALSGTTSTVFAIWAVSGIATIGGWLLAVAPRTFWVRFVKQEYPSLLSASAVALAVAIGTIGLQQLAPWLSGLTLTATATATDFLYEAVVFDPGARRIGTTDFNVIVSDACSGYEGIALVTVFLAAYLWAFRHDFHFPHALIAFPVGIVVIWMFNIVRITALIAIGDGLSPEVAMAGFHSNAGWIAFILVSIGLITLLHHSTALSAGGPSARDTAQPLGTPEALLAPFVVLMAATLLTSAFSAGFDVLYPLKVVATGGVLWYLWQHYRLADYRLGLDAVLIGITVFVAWIVLVPVDPVADATFSAQISTMPTAWLVLWMAFRLVGSALVVPLAEELMFRGYLLDRLSGREPLVAGRISFAWFPFLVTSVLFGLLHGAWLAGMLAGSAYAIARYRRGRLGDAIVAHMITNLLLSLYAITTQHWSYW